MTTELESVCLENQNLLEQVRQLTKALEHFEERARVLSAANIQLQDTINKFYVQHQAIREAMYEIDIERHKLKSI